MKCWKCGQEINDGTTECIYCHTNQRRSTPMTDIGRGMRQLYDHYGAEAVLTNPVLLSNGLGDVVTDTLGTNIKKLKGQLKMAMDAGLGRLYREQLTVGKPDERFTERVRILLTEDVGFNEKTADEMMGYFDEMIGWQSISKTPGKPDLPIIEINKQQIYEKAVRFMSSREYRKAMNLFEQIRGYKDTNDLIKQCEAKIDPSKPPKKGLIILICMLIAAAAVAFFVFQNALKKQRDAEATLQAYSIEQTGTVSAQLTIEAQQIADALETLQTQQTAIQQAINATQTKLAEPTATQMPTNTKVPTATQMPTNTKVPTATQMPTRTKVPTASAQETLMAQQIASALETLQAQRTASALETLQAQRTASALETLQAQRTASALETLQAQQTATQQAQQIDTQQAKSLYERGMEYYKNNKYSDAVSFIQSAADMGYAPAQDQLGTFYCSSYFGVQKSYKSAAYYYELAANQGNKEAQYHLAILYFCGFGVNQSYEDAIKYLTLSANQNYPQAEGQLGLMYEYGVGVKKDITTSKQFYQKVAENENSYIADIGKDLLNDSRKIISPDISPFFQELLMRIIINGKQGQVYGSLRLFLNTLDYSPMLTEQYAIVDLDSDGTDELILGYDLGGGTITDIYTVRNGYLENVTEQIKGYGTSIIELRENGVIKSWEFFLDDPVIESIYTYYNYYLGKLNFIESVIEDTSYNYYYSTNLENSIYDAKEVDFDIVDKKYSETKLHYKTLYER